MSDGVKLTIIIVYLLGIAGMLRLMESDFNPWWTPVGLFWPLAVPLEGLAWIVSTIYEWLARKPIP